MKTTIVLSLILGNVALARDRGAKADITVFCDNTMKELGALIHERAVDVSEIGVSSSLDEAKQAATDRAADLEELAATVDTCLVGAKK